jgi:hypothetical protein
MATIEAVRSLERIDNILNDVASLQRLTTKQRIRLQFRAHQEIGTVAEIISVLAESQRTKT